MKTTIRAIMASGLVIFVNTTLSAPPTGEEWTSLFNGRDLTGWQVPDGDGGHWKVVDGVIDYDAASEASGRKNLKTEQEFGDIELYIEWRFKESSGIYTAPIVLPDGSEMTDANGQPVRVKINNADSGIILRGSRHQINLWCWPVGSGELWSVRRNQDLPAEVRAAAVPKTHADKPIGQWNVMHVTLKGNRVSIVLNSQIVIENALIPDLPSNGPVELQHHGGRNKKTGRYSPASSLVQFRNIRVKQLP